jgi:hypothetical protein
MSGLEILVLLAGILFHDIGTELKALHTEKTQRAATACRRTQFSTSSFGLKGVDYENFLGLCCNQPRG